VAEIVAAVDETRRTDTTFPTIARVRSIFSLVPEDQDVRLAKIREIRTLVETEAHGALTGEDARRLERLEGYLQVDEPFTWEQFPESDKRQFINTNGEVGNFVFIYPGLPLRDGRNAIEFRNDIGAITTASGQVFHAASTNLIAAEMLELMLAEGRWAAVLSMLLVALLVWSDFRSVRGTLLVMLPLGVAFIWAGGIMALIGMKVNFYNMVVFPSIVGIGVDNGVHLFHRYLEEGPRSLPLVVRRTGWAILITTLTTMVGYSGLVMAHHPGLQSMGLLAVIGLFSAFLAAVVLLPSVIQILEKRQALPVDDLRE
jgi:predicted RND superfamily exporter protein